MNRYPVLLAGGYRVEFSNEEADRADRAIAEWGEWKERQRLCVDMGYLSLAIQGGAATLRVEFTNAAVRMQELDRLLYAKSAALVAEMMKVETDRLIEMDEARERFRNMLGMSPEVPDAVQGR